MTSTDFQVVPVWMREEYQKCRPDGLVIQQILGFVDETSRIIEALRERISSDHPLFNQIGSKLSQIYSMMFPVQAWTDIRLPSTFLPELTEFNCCKTSVFFTEKQKTQIVSQFVGDCLREFQKEHSLHILFFYNAKIVKNVFILFFIYLLRYKLRFHVPSYHIVKKIKRCD